MSKTTTPDKPEKRKYGSGTIYQIGEIYYLKYFVNGKQVKKSLKTKDYKEACKEADSILLPFKAKDDIEKLEIIKAKIATKEKQIEEAERLAKRVPLHCLLEEYYKRGNSSEITDVTKANYEAIYDRFYNWIKAKVPEAKYVDDVTQNNVKEFTYDLTSLGSASYNLYIRFLKKLWDVAEAKQNPWIKCKRKKSSASQRRDLTLDELKLIISKCDEVSVSGTEEEKKSKRKQIRLAFMISVYTGMRRYDVAHIQVNDIHLKEKYIKYIPHKTKRFSSNPIIVPMFGELYDELSNYKSEDSVYLLPYINHCYKTNLFKDKVKDVFKRAGIKMSEKENGHVKLICSFHSLRHTFVSICANCGIPLPMVQNLVGHTNISMTNRYYHQDLRLFKEKISLLPKITENDGVIDVESEIKQSSDNTLVLEESVMKRLLEYASGRNLNSVISGLLTEKEIQKIKDEEKNEWSKIIDEIMPDDTSHS